MKKILMKLFYFSLFVYSLIAQIQQESIPRNFNNQLNRIEFISINNNLVVDREFNPMVFKFGIEYDIDINILDEAEIYYNESLMVAEDQKGSISILCALSGLLETIILSESFNKCKYVFEKIDENADIIVQGPDWAKNRLSQSIEKLKDKTDVYEKEIEKYKEML